MLIRNKCFFLSLIFVIICTNSIVKAYAQDKGKPVKEAINKNKHTADTFVYDAIDKRDPFVALVAEDGRILEPPLRKANAGNIELEGIMYDPKGVSYTVINTEVYKAGDTIGEYRILRIERRKVVFLKAGKEREVELKKEE